MTVTSLRARRVPGTAPVLVEPVITQELIHLSVDGGRPVLLEPHIARQLADALHDGADTIESHQERTTR